MRPGAAGLSGDRCVNGDSRVTALARGARHRFRRTPVKSAGDRDRDRARSPAGPSDAAKGGTRATLERFVRSSGRPRGRLLQRVADRG